MACLVQSISHTPLWCLLLTMLIIPLSICRPSPSIIFPQIAVLLTREQFLKSLQTLYSFSQLLPPFWSGADLALSPGWLRLPCCLSSAKVPLLLSFPCNLLICQTHEARLCRTSVWGAKGGVLAHADCLQGPHTSPFAMGTYCQLSATQSILRGGDRQVLCFIQDFGLVPDSSVCAVKHQLRPVLQTQLPAKSMH